MNRTNATYRQLDKVLRLLGFSSRPAKDDPPGKLYEHKASGAAILLPVFPEDDNVLEYHMILVRTTLDNFGIADASTFDKKLQKAG